MPDACLLLPLKVEAPIWIEAVGLARNALNIQGSVANKKDTPLYKKALLFLEMLKQREAKRKLFGFN